MQSLRKYFMGFKACGLVGIGLFSSGVWAGWMPLGVYGEAAAYFDTSSVQTSGNIRKVWTMLDYRQPKSNSHGLPYRSTRSLVQIQCKTQQVKTLSLAFFKGTRGSGDVLSSEGVIQDWQPIPPDSVLAKMAWTVCGS